MEKWEYCWLRDFDPFREKGIAQVNQLGLEGWELVNAFYQFPLYYIAAFKRRLI